MTNYFSDMRCKEIIDIHSGFRLGYVCDIEFDAGDGRAVALIAPGKPRLLGILGREDDYVLPWSSIIRFGTDIILVETRGEFTRRKRHSRLFS